MKRRQQDARLTLRLLEFSLPEFHLISLDTYLIQADEQFWVLVMGELLV